MAFKKKVKRTAQRQWLRLCRASQKHSAKSHVLPSALALTPGKDPCFAECPALALGKGPCSAECPSPSTRQSSFLVDNKGHLPSAMVNALGKGSFCRVLHTANCLIVFCFIVRPELEHGDDYCTSWYEMKEVLRRRFAPPSGSSYIVAFEFVLCCTIWEECFY